MIEFVYSTLASLGYTHPLHPVITHLPMGMTLGGFMFLLASMKWENLSRTAFYCYALALIFVPVTALLGIMDWQHRLFGKVNNLIIVKLILTGVFTVLLSITVYMDFKGALNKRIRMMLYALCFINVILLGFVGGELAYG
jgi:uncharacterized membrane protein